MPDKMTSSTQNMKDQVAKAMSQKRFTRERERDWESQLALDLVFLEKKKEREKKRWD